MARMVGARNDPKAIKVVILSANSPFDDAKLGIYLLFSKFLVLFLVVFQEFSLFLQKIQLTMNVV